MPYEYTEVRIDNDDQVRVDNNNIVVTTLVELEKSGGGQSLTDLKRKFGKQVRSSYLIKGIRFFIIIQHYIIKGKVERKTASISHIFGLKILNQYSNFNIFGISFLIMSNIIQIEGIQKKKKSLLFKFIGIKAKKIKEKLNIIGNIELLKYKKLNIKGIKLRRAINLFELNGIKKVNIKDERNLEGKKGIGNIIASIGEIL